MTSEQVRSTNSLPFLKESEKDYWNKLLDSNIRAGTMACMWCMKAQLVKKTSLAFHRWKYIVARESWYGNSSPSKMQALNTSRPTSLSYPQSAEKPLNHAGARPVSAVLANAISLMNQLKETDAERDVNTRLFASPSASVKAANAAATSVLEFDSKSHGDLPKNLSGTGSVTSASGAPGAFPWERRRRAGSLGSIDTENGLFDSGGPVGEFKMGFDLRDAPPLAEGQSAETLAACNKQRLAYVLRSILPDGGAAAGGGSRGSGGGDQSYAMMNLDGTRRPSKDTSPGYTGEEELNAYLRNALLSQNHDATTRGQILMALSQNIVNKPTTQRNTIVTGTGAGGLPSEHGGNEHDLEVSSRSSLSLLRVSGSNPPAAVNTAAFPRARANSRSGSPNARLSRKSFDSYGAGGNAGGNMGNGGSVVAGGGSVVQGSVQGSVQGREYHDYTYDTTNNGSSRPHYADNTAASAGHSYNPETPDAYNAHGRTHPSSVSSLHPGGSVSGHSLHSEYTPYSHNNYSSNTSINNSASGKKSRVVPGYLMPTNSFRKKQSSASGGAKSGGIGSGRARSPGMITSSTSKHAAVLGSGGTSPTAYTVKGSGGSGGRSGSAGRGGNSGGVGAGGASDSANVFYATNAGSRATTPNHTHYTTNINSNATNTNNNTTFNANNTNTTNNHGNNNANTSYANMSFLDYQARKANLNTGHRSPVRRNSANIDTSRLSSGGGGGGGSVSGSVFGDEDGDNSLPPAVQVLSFPPMVSQMPPLAQMPPLTGTLPLGLSEPALPMSLHSQQPRPVAAAAATAEAAAGPTGDLVYEVYDTYHNSALHSNSSDLYDHSLQQHPDDAHTTNSTHINNTSNSNNSNSNAYAPHSPTEHILYNEDMTYYNHHPTSHTTHPAHSTHPTHTNLTHNSSQPFVANGSNTLRPTPVNTTNTTSSGKRSNPNNGGKKQPKGMDKAQLELMMYGDVHGRTPNWHKTLRN